MNEHRDSCILRSTALAWLLVCGLMCFGTACSDDGGTDQPQANEPDSNPDQQPEEDGCTEGFLGCACIDGTACFPGSNWVCLENTCREPACAPGSLDCTCYSNNTCDPDPNGDPMLCDEGVCKTMGCSPGSMGCVCTEGGVCDGELVCQLIDGEPMCAPDGCEAGTRDCPCGDARACNGALTCVKNTCIESTCRPGLEDCWCNPDFSCDLNLQCNMDTERCEIIPCTRGTLGCGCDSDQCDAPNAFCNDGGLCEEVDCPNGAEGCACLDGETCLVNEGGVQLFCEGNVCRSPDCAPGDVGCRCEGGLRCAQGGVCEAGVCTVADCVSGSENCGCAGGLCQSGLRCREDNLCVDGTGFINNPCHDNGTCERGGRCADNGICRRCTLGVIGCGCDDADNCVPGAACIAGACIAEADVPPQRPEDVRCFSRCQGIDGLEIDGEFVPCDSDGLIEACLDGRTCEEGTCVEGDDAPRDCVSELGCPYWQTCIGGLCMSECDESVDCPTGKQCTERVCRVPCTSNGDACPEGQHCLTDDGENGYCKPNHPTTDSPVVRPGVFTVDKTALEFTNNAVTQLFVIHNNSPTFQTFTIRKRSHLVQFADGTFDRARRAADGLIECDPEEQEGCSCDEDNPDECFCDGPGCFCSVDRDCDDNGYQCQNGTCRPSTCGPGQCPMFFLRMGEFQGDDPVAGEEIEVSAEAGAGVAVVLTDAAETAGVRWQGSVEIINRDMGTQTIDLTYNEVPEGQWAGEMVYLATFGQRGLEEWRVNQGTRDDPDLQEDVGNALIQRWGGFRLGSISWDEFQAVLSATKSGAWKFANVVEDCPDSDGACYLYDIGQLGLEIYSSDLESIPIPSGVVELPFAMNLHFPDNEGSPELMTGRIESTKALHYAGLPKVEMQFHTGAEECDLEAFGACVAFLDNFEADIKIGGRYLTSPDDTNCAQERPDGTYIQKREPWLVTGFLKDTTQDEETGQRYRYECKDSMLPFFSEDPDEQEIFAPFNVGLTASNPIPDARTRRRTLRLVDGALINQSQLLIFFEEKFESFLGGGDEGFSAYGYMLLKRRATDLGDEDENANDIPDAFEGSNPIDERDEPEDVLQPQCSDELLDDILGLNVDIARSNLARLVTTLIDGVPTGINPDSLGENTDEQVHYFCEETGLFDGGPANGTPPFIDDLLPNDDSCEFSDNGVCEDGGSNSEFGVCPLGTDNEDCGDRTNDDLDQRIECPAGSRVEFFTVDANSMSQSDIAALPCQDDGTCLATLTTWKNNSNPIIQVSPLFRCTNENEVFCDANRQDLRDGKTFFAASEAEAIFVQLPSLIDEAFRYKTRFKNRQGQGIGFTPTICEPDSDLTPYCYDPAQIEEIEARIDCLLHVHQNHYDDLNGNTDRNIARAKLDDFLEMSFSFREERRDNLPLPIIHDGFERELSQLQIMLGDESFTRAFASRFDLANSSTASFEGALFEEDGINLSGAVGFEMFSLYQAGQYYQKVLDRFFTMSPVFWEATAFGVGSRNFVTADTVLRYFDRVIRASTQKARTSSEIAKRYQSLNRPDLARAVTERAYTATYMESVIMSRMMLQILEEATLAENRDQIERSIEDAQLRYKVALVDMQTVHSTLSDNITIFGFAPDFIPFPALDTQDFRQSNAFEVLLLRVRNKMQFAREREELALNSNREFETNQAQFQSELSQIRNNFEAQLSDLCGTFVVNDQDNDPNNDRVFPGIKKYAHLNDRAALIGDPCGLVGNGQIHNALAGMEDIRLDARSLQIQHENILEEVDIEIERVSGQCREILEAADFLYGKCEQGIIEEFVDDLDPFDDPNRSGCIQAQINEMQDDITGFRFGINRLQQVQSILATSTNLAKCGVFLDGTDCPSAVASTTAFLAGTVITEAGISALEIGINTKEKQINNLERFKMKWQTENECDQAKVESTARVRSILLRLKELELEALRIEHRTRLALSEVERLRNQAKRLEAQQVETEQLTINVQAAHNNPNIRIYKNDAIINAEIAFDQAIREAYKLTKVFEYYTSTSYAHKNDLFLIRMIARGDKNLENYISEIENTFFEFEEFFGHPSNRVHIISLKDDVLSVPFTDENGDPIDDIPRTNLMRERLTDPSILDRNGYITIPFSTNFNSLSPLTRNHKILYVEADVYGNANGDLLGRIYLRQKGTSVIHGINDDKQFHRFDERIGVINTIFSGVRFFENTIYQNFTMRDRPFINTQWELVINQRDEEVNQDINLNALTDIRLYIYYTDFTVF